MEVCKLRYGINPNQKTAEIYKDGGLPFEVLNGAPGYINLMDAFGSYQLVKELKVATGLPSAASFKHVSPAGVGVGTPMDEQDKGAFLLSGDQEYSPQAIAYIKARQGDPVSSFGDFIALSDIVEEQTAKLINREVSDGVIAPGYTKEALEVLKAKKGGGYLVLKIDENYSAPAREKREIYGMTLEQDSNNIKIDESLLENIVTENKELSEQARIDAIISMIALKYTQSNSVCFAYNGQTIGIGAGQQSRIHCTRLASSKSQLWMLRRHPRILAMKFKGKMSRTDKYNAIDACLNYNQLTDFEKKHLASMVDGEVPVLSEEEKTEFINSFEGVLFSSDAFIPFRDNIDKAAATGAKYIIQTGGSSRDQDVIDAADSLGLTMVFTGVRLFTH